MHYCLDDIEERTRLYARQEREIRYSDQARALLIADGRRVIT
jgi:hypothetical protein